MGKKQEVSGEGEGLKVFGRPMHRRRARPTSYWLKAGLLAFIGALNLLAGIALLVGSVFIFTTDKSELQVAGFSIPLQAAGHDAAGAAAPEHRREALAALCLALSLVPFSLAVLARMQYQACKDLSSLPLGPAGTEQQNE